MAWTSLSNRLNDLPTILCGPMVRKVTKNMVSVFVVTKSPLNGDFKIYTDNGGVNQVSGGSTSFSTIQFGDHLHIAMCLIQNLNLTQNTTYYYNISSGNDSLLNDGLIKKVGSDGKIYDCSLSYDDTVSTSGSVTSRKLPSFKTPPDNVKDVRLFHGSCRKAVGEGTDAMPAIEVDMKINHNSSTERSQFLFLTGDQIYADDLSDTMLTMLIDAEHNLMGNYNSPNKKQPIIQENISKILPGNRKSFIVKESKLPLNSGDDKEGVFENHLFTMGEFMMNYMFAWSDVLWPSNDTNFPTITDIKNNIITYFGAGTNYNPVYKKNDKNETDIQYASRIEKQLNDPLKQYTKGLQKVRRILANIPTYMIFDDHEITDDWNIRDDWYNEIFYKNTKPTNSGTNDVCNALITNGLSAYCIFQDWGNKPNKYLNSTTPESIIFNKIKDALNTNNSANRWDELFVNIFPMKVQDINNPLQSSHLSSPRFDNNNNPIPTIQWDYLLPFDNYEVRALDSRTRRGYGYSDNKKNRALLINNLDLDRQLLADSFGNISYSRSNKTLILLAPCPLFSAVPNAHFIDTIFQVKNRFIDFESWENHQVLFNHFFYKLGQKYNRVLMLSGDVHYGYTMKLDVWTRNGSNYEKTCFIQCTSSSMRNQKRSVLSAFTSSMEIRKEKKFWAWLDSANVATSITDPSDSTYDYVDPHIWFDVDDLEDYKTYSFKTNSITSKPDIEMHMKLLKTSDAKMNKLLNLHPVDTTIFDLKKLALKTKGLGSAMSYRGVCAVNHVKKISFGGDPEATTNPTPLKTTHEFFYAPDENDSSFDNYMIHEVESFTPVISAPISSGNITSIRIADKKERKEYRTLKFFKILKSL